MDLSDANPAMLTLNGWLTVFRLCAIQHRYFAAERAQDNFRAELLDAIIIGPLPSFKAPLNEDLRALFQESLGDPNERLAEHRNPMPLYPVNWPR